MTRLIDADALKYHDVWKESWLSNEGRYSQAVFRDEIDAQPTIDAEPVRHGKWILNEVQDEEENANDNFSYRCSCCGYSDLHAKSQAVPYCWHCGARMDKDEQVN